jgi:flagellar protein FliS
MFAANNPSTAYKEIGSFSSIEASSPHKLVDLMLFTAIDRISQATGMIERNEIEAKGEAIGKAISIIEELRRTLNMNQGGEIAISLHDLYVYINERLVTANLKNDISILNECRDLIREIHEGWSGIPENVKNEFQATNEH